MKTNLPFPALLLGALVMPFVACTEVARLPISAGTGLHPTLPPPQPALVPTVHIAPAVGWPPGATPAAAPGTRWCSFHFGTASRPFRDGKPTGALPLDVLSGFLSADGSAFGRPVGVALDARGALLVADDVGNVVWRVRPQ